jgi:tRNA threonylcarbamoyladenosine biosynthesis protein TsaB
VTVLGFDTATAATAVALLRPGAEPVEARHDPAPGERPGHVAQLLPLVRAVLDRAGLGFADLDRLAVGVGPGTFTGLRIGVATARALAQAAGLPLVPVGTLRALALPAQAAAGAVLAVLDARRGEAFVAGWVEGEQAVAPAALPVEALAGLDPPPTGRWLAVGDGAVRLRAELERAGALVPADGDPLHLVNGGAVCRLALELPGTVRREEVVPQYLRLPDAELARTPTPRP